MYEKSFKNATAYAAFKKFIKQTDQTRPRTVKQSTQIGGDVEDVEQVRPYSRVTCAKKGET